MAHAFVLIMAVMVFVNVLVYVCMHPILWFLRVPQEVMEEMQQSVMNFGILMVQGLVNSFGATTMAAFAAAVKIDTFAYLPVQDFGNAYSTFVAQNYGRKITDGSKRERRKPLRSVLYSVSLFPFWCARLQHL